MSSIILIAALVSAPFVFYAYCSSWGYAPTRKWTFLSVLSLIVISVSILLINSGIISVAEFMPIYYICALAINIGHMMFIVTAREKLTWLSLILITPYALIGSIAGIFISASLKAIYRFRTAV